MRLIDTDAIERDLTSSDKNIYVEEILMEYPSNETTPIEWGLQSMAKTIIN